MKSHKTLNSLETKFEKDKNSLETIYEKESNHTDFNQQEKKTKIGSEESTKTNSNKENSEYLKKFEINKDFIYAKKEDYNC